jgi:hypothetical protein
MCVMATSKNQDEFNLPYIADFFAGTPKSGKDDNLNFNGYC